MRTGIAYRPDLAPWLATRPTHVRCLELSVDQALTTRLRAWPTALHAPRLSIGTPGPLQPAELDRVLRAAAAIDPLWIGTFLGHRHRPEPELSYPQPVILNRETLGAAIANCLQLIEGSATPVLVENIAAFGCFPESMCPARFLNTLCDESGCRVLLDVTALAVDARYGLDPRGWLWDVNPSHIAAIHVGGWAQCPRGRWAGRRAGHIPEDAWTLAREVATRGPVTMAILQRDGGLTTAGDLQADLRRLSVLNRVPTLRESRRQPTLAMA